MSEPLAHAQVAFTASAIILAAGEGSRMGNLPKCLIKIDQVPIISRQIETFKQAGIHFITVVTGFHHEKIEPVIAKEPLLAVVRNKQPEQGQQSSVKLGLEYDQGRTNVVMIALADQPLIEHKDIEELLDAFNASPVATEIMYPVVDGQRANPVLMSAAAVNDYLQNHSQISCRKYIDSRPTGVYQYTTKNDHFVVDLDTQGDLALLRGRTGFEVSL